MTRFGIGLALTLSIFFCSQVFAEDRPNIVFIFSDDHANHAIGAYE